MSLRIVLTATLLTLFVSVQNLLAQDSTGQMFLDVDGVLGASTDRDHRNWIEINSFEFHALRSDGLGNVFPDALYSDLHVEAQFDRAVRTMLENLLTGETIRRVEIERTESFGGQQRLVEEWTLSGAQLSEFQRISDDTVHYAFAFEQAEFCFIERSDTGAQRSRSCVDIDTSGHGSAATLPEETEELPLPATDGLRFMRVERVTGGSAEAGRQSWIDVDSFQMGATRRDALGNLLGQPVISDVQVTAQFDRATTVMLGKLATGETIPVVQIERTEPFEGRGQLVVEGWDFENVVLTGFHREDGESIDYALTFEQARLCITERSATGSPITVRCSTYQGAAQNMPAIQAGDADQDFDFDQLDLVRVQQAGKYLTGQAASWEDGDWNGAPGGKAGQPPAGDGRFNQLDIVAAQQAGIYLTGPYAVIRQNGQAQDAQTSLVYDVATGELAIDPPAGIELTSINIDSASGIFSGDPALNLGGSFDNDTDENIFKATFGSSFGALSFGHVAQAGMSQQFLMSDLSVVGSLAGGGGLGDVDLNYVPEPSTLALLALAVLIRMLRGSRGIQRHP